MLKQKWLIPQYMRSFQCTGSQCPDTCCAGWRVDVDKNTYKKYRNCSHPQLRRALAKAVTRNRHAASDKNYAKFNFQNRLCPFLTREKMCGLQQELGETYLSDVCAVYPRNINIVNGVRELAATVSCPEVARLALLNQEKMEFDETNEFIFSRMMVNRVIDTREYLSRAKHLKYFWELRVFTISLLQNRSYELWERLIILGLFFQAVAEYIEKQQVNEIPRLISLYSSRILRGDYKNFLQEIPVNSMLQLEIVRELVKRKVLQGVVESKTYLKHFEEFVKGLNYSGEMETSSILRHFEEVHNKYFQPFMKSHNYIMENYLVNYVFKDLFPFKFGKETSVFNEYIMLVIHYAMIKIHLIGLAGFYKDNFGTEQVLSLIWSFSRVVEHNLPYLKYISKLFADNGLDTMAYMAVLIKNG